MTPLEPVLDGQRILVTAQRRAEDLASALERRGAVVVRAAPIGVIHVDDEALAAGTRRMIDNPYDLLVITTGAGLRAWLETAQDAGLRDAMVHSMSGTRLIARGPKATGALRAAGLAPDWVADSESSSEIAEHLCSEDLNGLRIGVQQHAAGDDGLSKLLRSAGARPETVVIHRWGPPPDPEALADSIRAAAAGSYDAVVFTSAPGAAGWLQAVDAEGVRDQVLEHCRTGRLTAAAVGPVTAAPLRAAGIEPLVPERSRVGALIREVTAHLATRRA